MPLSITTLSLSSAVLAPTGKIRIRRVLNVQRENSAQSTLMETLELLNWIVRLDFTRMKLVRVPAIFVHQDLNVRQQARLLFHAMLVNSRLEVNNLVLHAQLAMSALARARYLSSARLEPQQTPDRRNVRRVQMAINA